ncbi:hypothetical protein Pcinc_014341 [Petrolisthes cinctipes]|uniref:Uncharacterized protein n=1 Tax=Petrolisthes cinctipes TaxID=88211 RepID=A0AAE1KRW0_PETCI|nr:hypothetical protein Pcinc_014341 [Petrolisthes cinctipes]
MGSEDWANIIEALTVCYLENKRRREWPYPWEDNDPARPLKLALRWVILAGLGAQSAKITQPRSSSD